MTAVMAGVRVIEVAEHGFVPGAGALLRDWGADVIKIEPVLRGDAARGLRSAGTASIEVMFQHANRGKRSLGLDLSQPAGRDILVQLVAGADVFMTNKLSRVRQKLRIDVDDLREHNDALVYVRGTGQGDRGPEADRGAYDLLTFWHRAGVSSAVAAPDGTIPFLPSPGFGDFIASMFLAGGTMGALFHRERTGEAPIVDGSLLATGMWAMGVTVGTRAVDTGWKWPPVNPNPLSGIYRTKDDRWLAFSCLQPAKYWGPLVTHLDCPDLADDRRFGDYESLIANNEAGRAELRQIFSARSLEHWCRQLEGFSGQWTVVQDAADSLTDPQPAANGYLQKVTTAAGAPFTLVAAPVQFDGEAAKPERAPEFNEHGDAILAELGLDWDTIVDLKLQGVVT
jgi:crotonobetainyl-CoA:carnitine CoA-transferase CaiB-like acyl-CoA transferase